MKAWFIGKLLREKVLVIGFVLLAAIIWLSSAGGHFSKAKSAYKSAGAELATQAQWLDNREAIERAADEAVANLDSSKTYDANYLVSEVLAMAKRAGLTVNTEPPRTQGSTQFAVHTVLVSSRRAEMKALLRFYQELSSRAPYLGLEELSLQGDRGAPGLVNINLRIASVELIKAPATAAASTAAASVEPPAGPVAPRTR